MKRFIVWLAPIVVLLVIIPVLLLNDQVLIAKISGVVVVLLTTFAIRYWLFRSKSQRVYGERVKLTINERYFLKEQMPSYNKVSASERKQFEERVGRLLGEMSFDNYDHTEAGREDCLAFAAAAVVVKKDFSSVDWKNKIVVFWDQDGVDAKMQGDKKVFFMNPQVLIGSLRSASIAENTIALPAEYSALLAE